MKCLGLFVILILQSQVFAGDLITCRSISGENLESRLRVYETPQGYAFEVSSCQMPSTPIFTHIACQPYQLSGDVQRQGRPAPGQVYEKGPFGNDHVEIKPYYGGFDYTDVESGLFLEFDPGACTSVRL